MGIISFFFVFVLLHVFNASLCVHGEELESLSILRCKKHELDALLKFKQSFTHDPMNRFSSWVGENCCQWHGVTCDNVTHNVVKLNLRTLQRHHYDYDIMQDVTDCLPDPQVSMVSSGVSSALLELKLLTHLDLSGNNFSGSRIPKFIGSLRHLRYLNLSSAGFFGPIPPQLGNLTNLVHLDLHNDDWRFCDKQYLLYGDDFGWASGLSKLQSLDMSGYNLSQAHDTFKVLSTLPSLSVLSLTDCKLHNSHLFAALIGNTSNTYFPTLQNLDLQMNGIEGHIPSIFKNMLSLRVLSLGENFLNGSVPLWLRAMGRLEVLDLNTNGFNYVEGGIMGIMGNPCNFKHLDLSSNLITQGDILDSFMSSSGCDAFELEYLDLAINNFTGGVPASFVKLTALKYLDLSFCRFNGKIPDFIGQLTEIEHVDISWNTFHGTVFGIGNLSKLTYLNMNYNNLNLNLDSRFNWRPPFQLQVFGVHSCVLNTVFPQWLRNQTRIVDLDLSYTGISGELPAWLWNLSSLQRILLSGNQLTGSLPQHITCHGPYHHRCNFKWVDLHDNLLTGTIPTWLGHLENAGVIDLSSNMLSGAIFDGNNASSLFDIGYNLVVLDLSDNMLSGEIKFGKVALDTQLEILSLRGNHFNGPIRSEVCHFNSLLVLDLAHNHLTGHIPPCLGSMPFYIVYGGEIGDQLLQIKVIVKGRVEVLTGTIWGQSIIDLSGNNLVGTIPGELTNMSALYALNLSYNQLTGHIPENIGNMKTVESLDLSNNHLSGTIPQSLSSISSLSTLNLSNNNLHGPIPKGNQLKTLDDPSIYAGNSGLCGFPLPDCPKPEPPTSSTNVNPTTGKKDVDIEDKYEKLWFILAVMSGVATGFWGVVGTLVIKRSWRQAYFRNVEELGDRIYVPIKVMLNRFKRRFNENS